MSATRHVGAEHGRADAHPDAKHNPRRLGTTRDTTLTRAALSHAPEPGAPAPRAAPAMKSEARHRHGPRRIPAQLSVDITPSARWRTRHHFRTTVFTNIACIAKLLERVAAQLRSAHGDEALRRRRGCVCLAVLLFGGSPLKPRGPRTINSERNWIFNVLPKSRHAVIAVFRLRQKNGRHGLKPPPLTRKPEFQIKCTLSLSLSL